MLTCEDALYHKMLLEAGATGELSPVIERLLAEEEPLSEVALELSFAGSDPNRQLSALNEYLSKADKADIDMDAVLEKLMEYFRRAYEKAPDDIEGLVALMYRVGMGSEYAYDNWPRLWICRDYYELSMDGIVSPARFRECLFAFLYRGESIDPWDVPKRKPGLIMKLKTLLHGERDKEAESE